MFRSQHRDIRAKKYEFLNANGSYVILSEMTTKSVRDAWPPPTVELSIHPEMHSKSNCLLPQERKVGPADCTYGFPKVVLDYIRSLVPGDVVGEIRPVNIIL